MNGSRCSFSLSLLAVALLSPCLVHADENYGRDTGGGPAHNFSNEGNIAISSDAALSIAHRTGDVTTITLAPALDYFVIPNLSIGGFISFDYTKSGDADATRFGIGPRVGYNIVVGDLISVWPKAGFAFTHSSASVSRETGNTTVDVTTSGNALALNLFVPIMFHPVQHFFAGFGPFLDADLSGDNKITVFGLKLTLGGWVG
jgi:hypothetical protein